MPQSAFRDANELKVGDVVRGEAQGQKFQAVITEVGDQHVMLDMNYPLASKTLHFDIEVVNVK